MKKIVILAAVAFLVAAGAGTGVRIVITPKPADEAEAGEVRAGADHAAAKPARGAIAAAPAREPAAAEVDPAHDGDAAQAAHASTAVGTTIPPVSLPAPGSAGYGGGSALQFNELGRILGGLDPEAAATFLAQVDDPTATRILSAMSVRQAVRVVDALPDDRGNRLWSDVMKSTGEK